MTSSAVATSTKEDNFDRHTLMVGEDNTADGITSDKLYAVDLSDEGKLTFQLDAEATKPPLLERTGLDLDETGSAATNYTVVTRLYPQADTINSSNTNLTFQFGASDIPATLRPMRQQSTSTSPLTTRSTAGRPVATSPTR